MTAWLLALPTHTVLLGGVLLAMCMAAAVIDANHMIIPDAVSAGVLLSGLMSVLLSGSHDLLWCLLSVILTFAILWSLRAIYEQVRGRVGLGLGDVKYTAAAAAWVGLQGIPSVVLIASVAALTWLGLRAILGRVPRLGDRVPFGPFLAFGLFATWLAAQYSAT